MQHEPISTGTTLLAFKYKDGLVIAADSRTSSGVYIASRITDKLGQITDNIFLCRSGSAADTQLIMRIVQREIKKLSLVENTRPSVEKAARLVGKIIYENKEHLSAAILVAGYDDGPKIYKINVCGTIEEDKDLLMSGSGTAFIYGYCDYHFKPDMSLEEALSFARTSVGLAIHRDTASGGVVRMAAINKDGVKRYFVSGENLLEQ